MAFRTGERINEWGRKLLHCLDCRAPGEWLFVFVCFPRATWMPWVTPQEVCGARANSHELISRGALESLMGRKRKRGHGRRKWRQEDFRRGHRARLRDRKGKGQRANATVV